METDEKNTEWQTRGVAWRRLGVAWQRERRPAAPLRAGTAQLAARHALGADSLARIRRRMDRLRGAASTQLPVTAQPATAPGRAPASAALDPRLQSQLEEFLRLRLPPIRIHTTAAADRLARRIGADAVTAGTSIYFRKGAFAPHSRSGVALLAHEATHIAWGQSARPLVPGPARADSPEESAALGNERRFLARRASIPLTPPPAAPAGPQTVRPPAASPDKPAPAFVKAASATRDLDPLAGEAGAPVAQLSPAALRALRDDLFDALLDRLRGEFERGA